MEEKEEQKSIRDEIRDLKEMVSQAPGKKKKKQRPFKLPFKARVSRSRLRKGYLTVAVIDDNMAVDFRREPIVDGTVKLDDTYHAIEDYDIFSYKGKPFVFQPKSKLNPFNPTNPLEGKNQTYGQKYVMARMEGERITAKKKIGWGISIGVLIIVGIIVYALFTGGGG